MSATGLKKFIKEIGVNVAKDVALSYAYENDFVTYDELSIMYGIKKDAVRKCIEYCIIYCIIELGDAIAAKNKAHRNQIKHMPRYSVRTKSDDFYDKLFAQRLKYIKYLLNVEKICELQYKEQTYDDYVCDADIEDGYPSKDTFNKQKERLITAANLQRELVNEYYILCNLV